MFQKFVFAEYLFTYIPISRKYSYVINPSHDFFRRANYPRIISFLIKCNWSLTFSNLNLPETVEIFYDALHQSILHFVPEVCYKPSKFPSWFTAELKSIVFDKIRTHAIYKKSLLQQDYTKFSLLRAKYKYLFKKRFRNYVD